MFSLIHDCCVRRERPHLSGDLGSKSSSGHAIGRTIVGACLVNSGSIKRVNLFTIETASLVFAACRSSAGIRALREFNSWRSSQSRNAMSGPSRSMTPKTIRWTDAPVPVTSSSTETISRRAERPSSAAMHSGRPRASSRAMSKRICPTPSTRDTTLVPRRLRSKSSGCAIKNRSCPAPSPSSHRRPEPETRHLPQAQAPRSRKSAAHSA